MKSMNGLEPQRNANHEYENFDFQQMTDIDVNDFEDYVTRRLASDTFSQEYKSLPPADQSRCRAALLPHNVQKNRFRQIYPYDETRVILHTGSDRLQPDFINASYITGYNGSKEYIATQGPYNTTLVDFWRMVWQEQSNRIVMVANVVEMGKARCVQYWPRKINSPETHGPFTITTEIEEVCADYTTRILVLSKKGESRKVHHFHFTTWQDKDKPLYGETSLLSFFRKVHAFDQFRSGPMIVHCSAGVGRTGTFIAIDILQYQAAKERVIDVFNCVKLLRTERMLMVQTKPQYIFIHKCMAEFAKCGDTSYDCKDFETTYNKLCASDPHLDGDSKLHLQFQLLGEMMEQPTGMKSKDGLLDENRHKNRDLDLVPDDFDRPHLAGKTKDDYINAVFVDSFRTHDYYLVTQMPLPDTVNDFWWLVSSVGASSIIMLNQFDNTDSTCKPYWPTKDQPTQTYGHTEVTLVKSNDGNKFDSIFTRDFLVKSKLSKKSDGVLLRHFQLLTWPSKQSLPPNSRDLLQLLELMEAWNLQHGGKRRPGNTIVHCLTGGVQSGVFCGASHVLERMGLEQEIDAFLAVRYVTRRRHQFFYRLDQYQFLYELALDAMAQPRH